MTKRVIEIVGICRCVYLETNVWIIIDNNFFEISESDERFRSREKESEAKKYCFGKAGDRQRNIRYIYTKINT